MKSDTTALQTPRETVVPTYSEQHSTYEIPRESDYQVFDARATVDETGRLTVTIDPNTDGRITMGAEYIFTTVDGEPYHWVHTTTLDPETRTVIQLSDATADVEFASWRLLVTTWDTDEEVADDQ
jgi:hypothetical protein